ncbi:MAG: ABC transporter permease subunit [Ruminococcaceae bacterium]|nr:ABC transporter permease subunit [Oscillospiraceae bacterium]
MNSIIDKIPKFVRTVFVLAFWVLIWHLVAVKINLDVVVSKPSDVADRLLKLLCEKEFYLTIFLSIKNILSGFLWAVLLGTFCGIVTSKIRLLDELISPVLAVIKATPVASFILLAYFLIDTEIIPSFISLLMVFPIIYGNVSMGIKNTPKELIEMTKTYNFSPIHRLTKLYLPSISPYFLAGFKTSLGLAWKAGIAAEVICNLKGSIGSELYSAKMYLETIDIFAWTVTIIVISMIIEKLLLVAVSLLTKKKGGGSSI